MNTKNDTAPKGAQTQTKRQTRDQRVYIRMTEEEYRKALDTASECGMTLSQYGRRLFSDHKPRLRLSNKEVEAINTLSDARADLIRLQNVLKGKPDEIKRRYFHDDQYMRAWIAAANGLIVRWGQIRDRINQN